MSLYFPKLVHDSAANPGPIPLPPGYMLNGRIGLLKITRTL
jgi:hypothetical protein